jgi:hypothetical protein
MSIFLPLFADANNNAIEQTDGVDEHSLSLLLSRAHLQQQHEMYDASMLWMQCLREKLTACMRAQYVHLVFEELQSVRLHIILQQQQLRLRTKALVLAHPKGPVAAATTLVASHLHETHVMLNPEEHVQILTRLMAEETVAEQQRDFMCLVSRSVMQHPVTTSCGTMYD